MQRLLRGQDDDQIWPTDNTTSCLIDAQRRSAGPPAALLCTDVLAFKDGGVNLPILLAIQATTDETDAWFEHPARIHALRCFRAFDPDWFDTAFDLTIARCLSIGLLKP